MPILPLHSGSYHTSVRLSNGKTGLLVDPGSFGNLVGELWLSEAAARMEAVPKMTDRKAPLQVGGVGRGAQQCLQDCRLPIALTRQDGSAATGTFSSPVVRDSGCPALLGLHTLQNRRAILDCDQKVLHFPADGAITLVLPPGSESFQLESAESGHLLLPCDAFDRVAVGATQGEHHLFADDKSSFTSHAPQDSSAGDVPQHLLSSPSPATIQVEEAMCQTALESFSFEQGAQVLSKLGQAWQADQANAHARERFHNHGFRPLYPWWNCGCD